MPVSPSGPSANSAGWHPSGARGVFAAHHGDDDLLALLLIKTWTLATGRVLRSDVPPWQLSEDELIAFWADDHIAPPDAGTLMRWAVRAGRR